MSGLPPAAVNAGASATAGTSNASDAAAASTASSPAQTNISLPNGPAIDSATRTNGRKRPREEEETPELATDATASETATPSDTPPSVPVPAAMFRPPGICASATDNADNGMDQGSKIASDDGTDDEIDRAMEETVLPAEEHLFRHMVDSSERLGCVAQPNPREYLYWKITDVVAGSQAQALGILVGHYIISVDGQRLVNGTSLTEVFQRAVSVGKPFEVVTSDFPVRAAAAAGRGQQQLLGNSDSGTEESTVNSDHQGSTSRTGTSMTPEQSLDDAERELPVSPEIRRAMTVANSPASKSPYHAFDRVSQSIVPGSTGTISLEFGIFRTELRKLIKQCTKRLCIFPQDGRPWLDYALNLVFASLWYNAPDRALGWNVATDEHRLRGLGVRAELKGPQPWMATRAFIVECIKNMLEAENNDWVTSSARKVALKKHHEYVFVVIVWCNSLCRYLFHAHEFNLSSALIFIILFLLCCLSMTGHVSISISKVGTATFQRLAILSCFRRIRIMCGLILRRNTWRRTVVLVLYTSSARDGSFSRHVNSPVPT